MPTSRILFVCIALACSKTSGTDQAGESSGAVATREPAGRGVFDNDVMTMLMKLEPTPTIHDGANDRETGALHLAAQAINVESYASPNPRYSEALDIYRVVLKRGRTADVLVGIGRVYYNVTVDYARRCCASGTPPSEADKNLIQGGLKAAIASLGEGLSNKNSAGLFDKRKVTALHEETSAALREIQAGRFDVLRLRPAEAVRRFKLGIGLHSVDPNLARQEYLAAIKLAPNYTEAHLNVAGTYYDQKGLRDAVTWWEKGLALAEEEKAAGVSADVLRKDVTRSYFDMAGAYVQLGDNAKARAGWEAVLRWDPQYNGAQQNLDHLRKMHPEAF